MRRRSWTRPEVLLPATFLLAILVGGVLLLLPGMASERVGVLEAFCAFMLPAAPSPERRGLRLPRPTSDMVRAGFAVNLVGIVLMALACRAAVPRNRLRCGPARLGRALTRTDK